MNMVILFDNILKLLPEKINDTEGKVYNLRKAGVSRIFLISYIKL